MEETIEKPIYMEISSEKESLTEIDMERWMNDYGTYLLRLCTLYLKDKTSAEDAVQDTYIRAWVNRNSFEGRSSEKTWLTKIAVNVCKNMLRSPWNRKTEVKNFEELVGISKNEYEQVNRQIDVMNAILKLKEKYRIVILLFYYEELSVKEMAKVLAEKEATVITQLKRAREKLGDLLTMFEKE
ncbi:MAG: sigma-70 family RNA polymerase sigma factor [Lachnospiraceae bacterium]|nr:sigma-70 family RNA polymerase sigma factor [Lachnospiraceae bacterium]